MIKEHFVISHASSSLDSLFVFFRDRNREFCSELKVNTLGQGFSFKERYTKAFITFPGTAVIGYDNYLI